MTWPGRMPWGTHDLTATPSAARTSSTVSAAGAGPESRNENVTARCAPTKALVRLVPVSSSGAPADTGPGTGDSAALGAGGGGGRIATGLVKPERPPLAVLAETGPVTAPDGTSAWMRVSLPARTWTLRSSDRP